MKHALWGVFVVALAPAAASLACAAEPPVINPGPTAKDWAAIAQQPDLSGVWRPARC